MERFATFAFVILLAATPHARAAEAEVISDTTFAVYRNGSDIGTRNLRISRNGDGLEVVNETRIAVDVLFITAFRRHERLVEVWRGGRLARFSSRVDNDGERFEVEAVRNGDGTLRVKGKDGAYEAPEGTLPATYWHVGVAMTDTLIHVMRGSLQRVTTARVGEETLEVGGEPMKTVRYRVTGDERVDLWFSEDGLIARAIHHTPGGDEIEFRARKPSDVPSGITAPGRAGGAR